METAKAKDAAPGAGAPAADDPLIGRVVGDRWRIVRPIGRGGMGVVYEGQNVAIGKRVALKFIEAQYASDAEVVSRFQREAESASAVESAHIVEVFDTGRTPEGQPYLVMELLRGESLGARVKRLGRLPATEAAHVAAQALRGLSRAHAAGVIHRDLKPDNLFLVDRDDDALFTKILDFGISKVIPRGGEVGAGTLTQKGTVLGTPFYMSPEQAQAQADLDERTDLFSMGAILFECLTGNPPHAGLGTYEAVIVAICTRDVPDVRDIDPTVPRELSLVVKKALSRDRDARFSSAAQFLAALRVAMPSVVSARDGAPSHPTPVPAAVPAEPTSPPTRTSWTARNASAAGGVPGSTPPPPAPSTRGKLALLGLGAATVGLVGTLLVMRARPPVPTVTAAPSSSSPEVTLRLVVGTPGARIVIDDAPRADGVVRGPALSAHTVHVEADGYAPLDRTVVLDGRSELPVELSPAVTSAAAATSGKPSKPALPSASQSGVASGGKKPVVPATGTTVAPPPATTKGGGLQLKVDP